MLVSVVMITYNHERYIEKAIESVLSQKGDFEMELLIGNDKSPDNTQKILEKYKNDKRVKIFNREKNLGATKNSFDLKLKANGEYIAILEGDDYWLDNHKLEKQLNILKDNKIALVYGDSIVVNENNKKIGEKIVKAKEIKNIKSLMANKGEIPTGTIIYKNIFKDKNNLIKLKKLLTSSEIIGDYPFFYTLLDKGNFVRLPEIVGAYRFITDSNNSTSYSSRSDLFKELELYKATKGIYNYYDSFSFYRWCLLRRRENILIKEIKKNKKDLDMYFPNQSLKDNTLRYLYKIYKPIDDLILSLNKKKYKKEEK